MKRYRILYAQVAEMEAIIETDEPLAKLHEKDAANVPLWSHIIRHNMRIGTDYPVTTGTFLELEGIEELP